MKEFTKKLKLYLPLIKLPQTILLVFTGLTGYFTKKCPVLNIHEFLLLFLTLFLSVSSSTILNMYIDRDIDSKMERTKNRPLPSGKLNPKEVLMVGLGISILSVLTSFYLNFIYGIVIFMGLFFDVIVYTLWLKRKSPFSIVWGGIAGGMPILAGRTLAVGRIDGIGLLFAFSILLWIPTHILTFNLVNFKDYEKAGIPTFPSRYGEKYTRTIIAISTFGTAISIVAGFLALGLSIGYIRLFIVLSFGLFSLSLYSIYKPSKLVNFGLFKYASIYMFSAMLLIIVG